MTTVREIGQKSLCPGIFFFTNKDLAKKGNKLMIEKGIGFQTLHESKTQEEKENEELNLFNALNPGDPELSIGRLPLQLLPLLDKPKIGPRGATAPHTYDERTVTLSKTQQSNRFQHDGWQNWSEGKSMSKGGSERVSVCVCVSQISCMRWVVRLSWPRSHCYFHNHSPGAAPAWRPSPIWEEASWISSS